MVLSTSIPFEIIDDIISHNYEDTKTLRSCSLVAHSFVDSCQKHIFSSILLNLRYPERRFEIIRDILIENPRISSYVRHIHLQDYVIRSYTFQERPDDDDEQQVMVGMLSSILPHLIHLQKFTFVNLYERLNQSIYTGDWTCVPAILQKTLLTLFTLPSLTTINIGDFSNFPIHHFRQCPQLKQLKLHSIVKPAANNGQSETSEVPLVPILESLEISDMSAMAAILLQGHLDLSQLQELRMRSRNGVQGFAADIMRGASQTIETFVWQQIFSWQEARADFDTAPLYLDLMPNLRVLSLYFHFSEWCNDGHLNWVVKCLENTAARHVLEEINIVLYFKSWIDETPELWEDTDWASRFDSILTPGDFPRLQRVTFLINHSPREHYEAAHNRFLHKKVPRVFGLLREKGKLMVVPDNNVEYEDDKVARLVSFVV